MSNSRIKQIKQVLANHDVRDPHSTLASIELILAKKSEKKAKPVLTVKVFEQIKGNEVTLDCMLLGDEEKVKAMHVRVIVDTLKSYAEKRIKAYGVKGGVQ